MVSNGEHVYGDEVLIAETLAALGLDASHADGWVFVNLPDGRQLEFASEYGAALTSEIREAGCPGAYR